MVTVWHMLERVVVWSILIFFFSTDFVWGHAGSISVDSTVKDIRVAVEDVSKNHNAERDARKSVDAELLDNAADFFEGVNSDRDGRFGIDEFQNVCSEILWFRRLNG